MKQIKMFGLAALAALMAMAFVGASSAMAEGPTALCKRDESPCVQNATEAKEEKEQSEKSLKEGKGDVVVKPLITHVHEESTKLALLLSSFATVECNVLFLGDALNGGLSALVENEKKEKVWTPLVIHGTFTYSCLNGCTATEENGPAEIEVLKLGAELVDITGEGLVHVVCILNCRYNGENLVGHGVGALTAANKKGLIEINEAVVNKESGIFCPATSKLDISLAPLTATYIST